MNSHIHFTEDPPPGGWLVAPAPGPVPGRQGSRRPADPLAHVDVVHLLLQIDPGSLEVVFDNFNEHQLSYKSKRTESRRDVDRALIAVYYDVGRKAFEK